MLTITRCSFLPPQFRVARYSAMSTIPAPICRKFVPVEKSEITSISKTDAFKFRLVSYNILAQAYVKSSIFPHSPAPSLKWKARSQAILTVLKSLEADFLCLQEVDVYMPFTRKMWRALAIQVSIFKEAGKKETDAGFSIDGTKLVMHEKIDYNDLVATVEGENTSSSDDGNESLIGGNKEQQKAGSEKESRGDPNDPRVRLKRDCVGLMAVFRLKSPAFHHVIIANTHIYWDPEWADIKLAQAKYLLSRLAEFKMLVSEKFDCSPSIIVAGDFNSIPGDQVYQYLVSGTNHTGPETADGLPIPLSSVYAFARGEPEFTNCTPDFTNTLDYIFFSPDQGIKPVSYLELPEAESPDVSGGLPNYFHPSDHLPIGTEFEVEA